MAKPKLFAGLAFEAAVARSQTDSSILIIDAMAAWCGPCQQMDATTWLDDEVVARLSGPDAFAIQIDVDRDQDVAATLEVTSMPTLIAFVNGVEHDRIVGGRAAQPLLEWIDLVAAGDTYEAAQRRARVMLNERRKRAPSLLADQRYDEALADYVWLWAEGRDAKLESEIATLVAAHPPAIAAFTELRDAAAPAGLELQAVYEWMTLNRIVGDGDATIRWYDANAMDLPSSRATANLVEVTVLPLLIARERWKDIGKVLADPVATFHRLARTGDRRSVAGHIVRALYAAGRDERASDVEFEASSADPSKEMAAVLAAAKQR